MNFVAQFAAALTMNIIGYLMQPKPKDNQRKPTIYDFKTPTAEPGRAIPIICGTVIVRDSNILYEGEKQMDTRNVKVAKK